MIYFVIVTIPNKYVKCTRDFGAFLFLLVSILFYILGALLIKQLFYSRLLDMR